MRHALRHLFVLSAALAAWGCAVGTAGAGDATAAAPQATPVRAVVELFTSQGCSSCPPADAVLKALADDPTIMALSLPVDYWDYLGWKDSFASPRNSERQRAYAKARGDGAIYTPQAVINGTVHLNGSGRAAIDSAIQSALTDNTAPRIPLRFWQERNTLNIAVSAAAPGVAPREATLWLGLVQTNAAVEVKHGENEGKQLTYTNVVRELTAVGLWKGEPLMVQIPRGAVMLAETQRAIVLVQEGRAGPIIGAAWADLF